MCFDIHFFPQLVTLAKPTMEWKHFLIHFECSSLTKRNYAGSQIKALEMRISDWFGGLDFGLPNFNFDFRLLFRCFLVRSPFALAATVVTAFYADIAFATIK